MKYFIANEGVCSVSAISRRGSSDRERASCRDLSGESDSGGEGDSECEKTVVKCGVVAEAVMVSVGVSARINKVVSVAVGVGVRQTQRQTQRQTDAESTYTQTRTEHTHTHTDRQTVYLQLTLSYESVLHTHTHTRTVYLRLTLIYESVHFSCLRVVSLSVTFSYHVKCVSLKNGNGEGGERGGEVREGSEMRGSGEERRVNERK